MRAPVTPRTIGIVVLVVLSLLAGLFALHGNGDSGRNAGGAGDIRVIDLPPEARQTLALIKQGGPFPYSKDGTVFHNREGRLPPRPRGYYREYTVPTPGVKHRGARRIVAGQAQDYWYTADHYETFRRIRE